MAPHLFDHFSYSPTEFVYFLLGSNICRRGNGYDSDTAVDQRTARGEDEDEMVYVQLMFFIFHFSEIIIIQSILSFFF